MGNHMQTQSNQNYALSADIQEKVLVGGDLSKLSANERLSYISEICKSLNLNPLTRPFEYITLKGKLTLYAKKDATEQLRKINNVSINKIETQKVSDVYLVNVYASLPSGRVDSDVGAVTVGNLKGDELANALMKAVTKSKRRVTLSICGLGILDETELETIKDVKEYSEFSENKFISDKSEIKTEEITDFDPSVKEDLIRKMIESKDFEDLKKNYNEAISHARHLKCYSKELANELANVKDSVKDELSLNGQKDCEEAKEYFGEEGEEK